MVVLRIAGLAAVGIVVALALSGPRAPTGQGPPPEPLARDAERGPHSPRAPLAAQTVSGAAAPDAAAQRIAELDAMSESFRNTSLLRAVRDAGYYCEHVVDTVRGGDSAPVWRIACSGPDAYIVGVGPSGELIVDSAPYIDVRDGSLRLGPFDSPQPGDRRR